MNYLDIVLGVSALVTVASVPIMLILVLRTRATLTKRQQAASFSDADLVIERAQRLYAETKRQLEASLGHRQHLLDSEARAEIDVRLNSLGVAKNKIIALKHMHLKRFDELRHRFLNSKPGACIAMLTARHNMDKLEKLEAAVANLIQEEKGLKAKIDEAIQGGSSRQVG